MCSGLTSVDIPNSVTSIGTSAFSHCSSLTSITIPNSVTKIDYWTFRSCGSLTSVTIPNSVTIIENGALGGCTKLTKITIPSTIKIIGEYAFQNCVELTDVYCYAESVPNTYTNAFLDSYIEYCTLHIPASSLLAYKSKEPWNKFGTIVAMDETTMDVDDADILPITVLTNGNQLTVSGTEVGEEITVYDMAGMIVGSAKATSQTTTIRTTLQKGETGIVKVGEKSMKVVVKK